jgi:hypothetical protein
MNMITRSARSSFRSVTRPVFCDMLTTCLGFLQVAIMRSPTNFAREVQVECFVLGFVVFNSDSLFSISYAFL